jgi:hypothetical protein
MKNLTWQAEYHRRLRRVVGVTDDTLAVTVEGGETGVCHTCADYCVTVEVRSGDQRVVASKEFDSFAAVLNAIMAVDWVDVH